MIERSKKLKTVAGIGYVGDGRDDKRFFGMPLPGGDFGKAVCILTRVRGGGNGFLVQREISEKVAMLMAFYVAEWNVLIINSLNPFKVIMEQTYRICERIFKMHVNTYSSVGGVVPEFRFLCNLNKFSETIAYVLQRFFVPVFQTQGIHSYPHWSPTEIFFVWMKSFNPVMKVESSRVEKVGASLKDPILILEAVKNGSENPLGPNCRVT